MNPHWINDRYRVERRLGSGAQGDVLLAMDEKLGRYVAIKLLHAGRDLEQRAEQVIRREAMVMARFDHRNVASVYDYDVIQSTGMPFLVMEYVSGETLDQLRRPLAVTEMSQMIAQVGDALGQAHENGMVHRDLKPSNLLVSDRLRSSVRFVILDLGIAKLIRHSQPDFDSIRSMTFSGAGTPAYMAPEQVDGKNVDHRADIYALGTITFELMSGRLPIGSSANSLWELLSAVTSQIPVPLSAVTRVDCPPALNSLVMQCLEKEPTRRPGTVAEFVSRFRQAYESSDQFRDAVLPPSELKIHSTTSHENSLASRVAEDRGEARIFQSEAQHHSSQGELRSSHGGTTPFPPPVSAVDVNLREDSNWDHSSFRTAPKADSRVETNQVFGASPKHRPNPTRMRRGIVPAVLIAISILATLAGGVALILVTVDGREPRELGPSYAGPTHAGAMPNVASNSDETTTEEGGGNEANGNGEGNGSDESGVGHEEGATSDDSSNDDDGRATNDAPPTVIEATIEELALWTSTPSFTDNRPIHFQLEQEPPDGVSIDPSSGLIRWTPSEEQGPGEYDIVWKGILADQSEIVSRLHVYVTEQNSAPMILPMDRIEVDELTELRLSIDAEDSDIPSPRLKYSIRESSAEGAAIDPVTGELSWTPTESDGPGEFEFIVGVSDGLATSELRVDVRVGEVNSTPSLKSISAIESDENRPIHFQLEGRDVDVPANDLRYRLVSDRLETMSFDSETGHFAWTPSEAFGPGDYVARFAVSDGIAESHIDVPIKVLEVSRPPEFDAVARRTVQVGQDLKVGLAARDLDLPASKLEYRLVHAPESMTVNESTGELRWSPGYDDMDQTYRVTIEVSKGEGMTSEQTLFVTVSDARFITNSLKQKMKLALIPPGEFMMGSPESEKLRDDWEVQHKVKISRAFFIGAYEVTYEQFREFVDDTGYETESERNDIGGWGWDAEVNEFVLRSGYTWFDNGLPINDRFPITNVSWNDAVRFCEWLSEKEGKTYRLPTEAEWEYVCRSGTKTQFNFGDQGGDIVTHANVLDQRTKRQFVRESAESDLASLDDGHGLVSPVGSYRPNSFGVYDLHGNVSEWCSDWYDEGYYRAAPIEDPQGPVEGLSKIARGGSLTCGWACLRTAARRHNPVTESSIMLGFRVVLELEQ